MASWDFEIPFSQYTELQQEYGHMAQVQLLPMVTSMEIEPSEQGRLRLKAGLSGQYMVYDTQDVSVVEDAYSPDRAVSVRMENVEMPAVLERQSQRIRAEQTAPFGSSRVADVAFYPGCPRKQRRQDEMDLELPGIFQSLYYDTEGVLQASSTHWQGDMSVALGDHAALDVWCSVSGKPQASAGEESTVLRGEMLLDTVASAMAAMPMVTCYIATYRAIRPSVYISRYKISGAIFGYSFYSVVHFSVVNNNFFTHYCQSSQNYIF